MQLESILLPSPQLNPTPWPQFAREQYRLSDRHLQAKLVPNFEDRGALHSQRSRSPAAVISVFYLLLYKHKVVFLYTFQNGEWYSLPPKFSSGVISQGLNLYYKERFFRLSCIQVLTMGKYIHFILHKNLYDGIINM